MALGGHIPTVSTIGCVHHATRGHFHGLDDFTLFVLAFPIGFLGALMVSGVALGLLGESLGLLHVFLSRSFFLDQLAHLGFLFFFLDFAFFFDLFVFEFLFL